MKKMLWIFLAFLIPILAHAGQKTAKPSSFDLSLSKLPSKYRGHDLNRIFQDLSKIQSKLARGEFETTEQHFRRLDKLRKAVVVAGLPLQAHFAYKLNEVTYVYDADTRSLDVTIMPKSVYDDRQQIMDDRMALDGARLSGAAGQYLASNIFGASVVVNRISADSVEIVPSNPEEFFSRGALGFANRTFDLPPVAQDRAARLVKGLSAIVIYQIEDPTIYTGYLYGKPTMSDPIELLMTSYYILAKIEEIWFYDAATGEIFLKAKPSSSIQRMKNAVANRHANQGA